MFEFFWDKIFLVIILDNNGTDLITSKDTPLASKKEDSYLHFGGDVIFGTSLNKLPKGMCFVAEHFSEKSSFIINILLIDEKLNIFFYKFLKIIELFNTKFKVNGTFVQTFCIEKDSYMDAI